jgi:DNA-binding transcriptional LysR family regulator
VKIGQPIRGKCIDSTGEYGVAPSRLELHSLIVFYYVANEQSITAAADKLCLTQPTVTYHIRSLEKNVGIKLLDIRRQKVFLTYAGKGLFKYVKEIYQQLISAEKYLEDIKETSLRVGISMTFSTCATSAASAFEQLFPHVRLIIRSSSSFEVVDDVLSSQVDLGIVVGIDYKNPKLKTITLSGLQKMVLVASPSSPIAQRDRLSLASLCGYPLILGPETSATRQIILQKIKNGGCNMPTPIVVEVNSLDWGINLVENGGGMGLYHEKSVEKAISEGRLKALPLSKGISVVADAVLRADAPEHPMARKFITLAKECFKVSGKKHTSSKHAEKVR